MGFCKLFILQSVGVILAIVWYGFYYAKVDSIAYKNPEPVEFEGPLEINQVLASGHKLLIGSVGPESIEVDSEGNLYTGLVDGRIVKVHRSATGDIGEGLVEDFFIGPVEGVDPVDNIDGPGRPLGLRFHGEQLYVIDAYFGLYSVNLKSKEVRVLVKPDDVSPPMKFPNDLDITRDGKTIYFTDTSSKWNLALFYYDIIAGECTGRVLKLDVASGEVKVLSGGICFANGVQLSADEKTLTIAETTRFRVLFIDTATGQTKKVVVMPGMPDNIRSNTRRGYWVALPITRSLLIDWLTDWPSVRNLASGLLTIHTLASFGNAGRGAGVELDENGKIIGSVHDFEGKTCKTVSQITEIDGGFLFAGSYKESKMVKIKR